MKSKTLEKQINDGLNFSSDKFLLSLNMWRLLTSVEINKSMNSIPILFENCSFLMRLNRLDDSISIVPRQFHLTTSY